MATSSLESESEESRASEENKGDQMIPAHAFAQHQLRENDENDQCDDFLQNFELIAIEHGETDPVGWHLETIFEKSDAPRDQDDEEKGPAMHPLEMPVPSTSHEDIRRQQEQDGSENR
jgi:hypothetical protein